MEQERKPGKKAGGVHAGHRSRMRRRFLETGLEGFQDHEVLEFLLFYAVPRRNVNQMAHMLLERFGTLAGALDASEEELQTVPGIGPRVANFLKLIPQIMAQMARVAHPDKPLFLRTPKDLEVILDQRCPDCPVGHLLLILTNEARNVVATHLYDRFEVITPREVMLQAANTRASYATLAERVEDCTDIPHPDRLQALEDLAKKMGLLEVPLLDYYAVDLLGHSPRSYARAGLLLPR